MALDIPETDERLVADSWAWLMDVWAHIGETLETAESDVPVGALKTVMPVSIFTFLNDQVRTNMLHISQLALLRNT